MANLYIMVGIPGSGKSTYAKQLDGVVCSSDQIRKELYGSESILGSYYEVFKTLDEKVKNVLESGQNAIYDATNLTKNGRKNIINKFRNYAEKIIIVFMNTPLPVALERNKKRERKVPKRIIRNMSYSLEEPTKEEADELIVVEVEK